MITHKLIVLYRSDLLAVRELAVSAQTCTRPLSEFATVSVGCEEVSEMRSGRRRCVWGSWHLQTQCTRQVTLVSGGVRQTTLLCLSTHAACNDDPMCYLVHSPVQMEPQNRYRVDVPWVKGVPGVAQLIVVPRSSTRVSMVIQQPHSNPTRQINDTLKRAVLHQKTCSEPHVLCGEFVTTLRMQPWS